METNDPIELSPEPETSKRDNLFAIAISVSIVAILIAVMAVSWSWRAIDESGSGGATEAAGGGSAMVSLTEFTVPPVTVGVGGSLMVMNDGTATHNLTVEGTDLKTPDIAPGGEETLALGDLEAGTYAMFCQIPGHKEAGMSAELTVAEGGGDQAATDPTTGSGDTM